MIAFVKKCLHNKIFNKFNLFAIDIIFQYIKITQLLSLIRHIILFNIPAIVIIFKYIINNLNSEIKKVEIMH